jgi:hypothetical protein
LKQFTHDSETATSYGECLKLLYETGFSLRFSLSGSRPVVLAAIANAIRNDSRPALVTKSIHFNDGLVRSCEARAGEYLFKQTGTRGLVGFLYSVSDLGSCVKTYAVINLTEVMWSVTGLWLSTGFG